MNDSKITFRSFLGRIVKPISDYITIKWLEQVQRQKD